MRARAETSEPGHYRIPEPALAAFIETAFGAAGLTPEEAATAARALVIADLRGVESHGVARLPGFLRRLGEGLIDPHARLTVDREGPSTLALCANNGLGLIVAGEAMDRCIAKAEATGICATTVRQSNHFGIAGTWAAMAAERGMGGMAMTNASRLVVPTFAKGPMLGTNPLAFAVPTGSGRPLVLDMSTSTVAWGKIEIARRAGLPIPEGWAFDIDGRPTTEAAEVKGLAPLGGTRVSSGHKGYGLSVMVDVLCGPLSGNAWSFDIAPSFSTGMSPGIGHFFMAWRIDAFRDADEFTAGIDAMLDALRSAPVGEGQPSDRVLVPGDPEAEAEERNRRLGIPVRHEVMAELEAAVEPLGVPFTIGESPA
ncbi:MAG: Malate dehydrogenase [uncultured Thermomicrobiales bacterium]|uniref:Malate dehydrogenase n=1 Tax=uncultured Thermomicrobiales bacterium TaxID=1645740 RepID=A0A6J4VPD7_9BACT|nr:MAG: Malate dehydrogenase [uncultured Thermomicrobiales bacterium]